MTWNLSEHWPSAGHCNIDKMSMEDILAFGSDAKSNETRDARDGISGGLFANENIDDKFS